MALLKAIFFTLNKNGRSSYLFFLIALVSCVEESEPKILDYPTVVTRDAQVTTEGVTFEAEVMYFRGEVLEKGFVWSSKGSPISGDPSVIAASADRKFSATIKSGLIVDETYYMRAYAKTDAYTVYGDTIKFTSLGGSPPIITDFFPKSGSIGSEITITGQNLNYEIEAVKVRIGEFNMTVKSVTDTEIVFKIPQVNLSVTAPITIDVSPVQISSTADFEIYYPWKLHADWSASVPVASFTDGNLAYFVWANSGVMTVFNPVTLQWLPTITMPSTADASTLATYSGGIVYMVFGTSIFRYNIATGVWDEFGTYSTRTDDDFIFVMGNELYLGSFDSGTLQALDMMTNTWVEKKGLKVFSGVTTNSGTVVQNKAFFGIAKSLYSYEAASNSWMWHGYFGGEDSYALFAIGDEVFMGHGKLHYYDGNSYVYNYFYSYNVQTGVKKQYQKSPVGMAVVASFAINNKGYLFAESGPNRNPYQKIMEFDPTRN